MDTIQSKSGNIVSCLENIKALETVTEFRNDTGVKDGVSILIKQKKYLGNFTDKHSIFRNKNQSPRIMIETEVITNPGDNNNVLAIEKVFIKQESADNSFESGDDVLKDIQSNFDQKINELRVKSNHSILRDRLSLCSGQKRFLCDICSKTFSTMGNLKMHIRIHTGEKPFQCEICNKTFVKSSDLFRHERVHSGEKPYECDLCQMRFSTSSNVKKHKRLHNSNERYKCEKCSMQFERDIQLKIHKQTHFNDKSSSKVSCNVVNIIQISEIRPTEQDVLIKQNYKINESVPDLLNATDEDNAYHDICEMRFENGHNYIEDQSPECDNLSDTDDNNQETCDTRFRQIVHINQNYTDDKSVVDEQLILIDEDIIESYQGPLCDQDSIVNENYMNADVFMKDQPVDDKSTLNGLFKTIEHNYKLFECEVCTMMFQEEDLLINHKQLHIDDKFTLNGSLNIVNLAELIYDNVKLHQCDICSIQFEQEDLLTNHFQTHLNEKTNEKFNISVANKLQCDICNKFLSQSSIKAHKRLHTDEKLHQCELCSKRFARLSNMKLHQLVHTGKKQYQCEVCNRLFSRLGNMKLHKLTHTGEKPHECHVCNKCFIKSSDLSRHKRIHTGERPYPCTMCAMRFNTSNSLNRHKRLHATGEVIF